MLFLLLQAPSSSTPCGHDIYRLSYADTVVLTIAVVSPLLGPLVIVLTAI